MHILTYSLGELQANCYLLIQDNECLLIDPADEAGFLLEEIQRRNVQLVGIVATHGHFDHVMAVGEIQLSIDVPFYIHKNDIFLIKRLDSTAKHFLGHHSLVIQPKNVQYITDKTLNVTLRQSSKQACFTFRVFETPGHTPGGCCFYFPEEQVLFTGDTLFKNAVGRTDLSYSSKKDLNTSINRLIEVVPEETTVYPGHGETTTIMDEKINLKQ